MAHEDVKGDYGGRDCQNVKRELSTKRIKLRTQYEKWTPNNNPSLWLLRSGPDFRSGRKSISFHSFGVSHQSQTLITLQGTKNGQKFPKAEEITETHLGQFPLPLLPSRSNYRKRQHR